MERLFEPNKAARIGRSEAVENLDFRETSTSSRIINSINDLRSDLKGATPEDFDTIFGHLNPKTLPLLRDALKPIVENLDRIIDKNEQSK